MSLFYLSGQPWRGYEVRHVVEGTTVVALVITAKVAGDQAGAARGVAERAREEGVKLRQIDIWGQKALYGRISGQLAAAGATACDFIVINVVDLFTIRVVGKPLLGQPAGR